MLGRIFGGQGAWGAFFLRLALGAVFIGHGAQNLFGAFSGPGLKGFSHTIARIGLSPPSIWALIFALIQFIGGIFLVLGILTRPAALLLGLIMAAFLLGIYLSQGFFGVNGFEYPLVLFAGCLSLLLTGGGAAALRE